MPPLDARTIANRENAKKSTGPKTEAGKVRSRANAFRHGLTGRGVAWPEEDQARIDAFVAEQVRLERPQDEHEAWLVARSAVLAWQTERAEGLEAANAHVRSASGRRRLLESRQVELEQLVAQLDVDPIRSARALLWSEPGCEWFADALHELLDLLERGALDATHVARVDALCGPNQPGMLLASRARRLALAVAAGDPSGLLPRHLPGLEPPRPEATESERDAYQSCMKMILDQHRPAWTAELRTLLEDRIADVEARLADFRAEPDVELELADVLAAFDNSPLGERLRRHLRGLARERKAVLRELAEWRADREGREQRPAVEEPVAEVFVDESPARPAREDRSQPVAREEVPTDWVRFAEPVCGQEVTAPPACLALT